MRRVFPLSSLIVFILFTANAATAQRPELVVQAGHREYPRSVSFAPDGRTFVTASRDRTLKLWEAETGRLVRDFVGHAGNVERAVFSPDGKLIASAGYRDSVRLWDVSSGALVREFDEEAKKTDVRVVAFSPDGRTLAASSDKLKLWDVGTGRLLRDLGEEVYAAAFSPDGKLVAGVTLQRAVKLWETATGRLARTLEANAYLSREAISFAPDGATLAVVTYDASVDLWDVARASVGRSLKSPHYREIDIARFSPDGKRLLVSNVPHTAHMNRSLDVWDVAAGEIAAKVDGTNLVVDSVAFGPDGRTFVAVGSGERTGSNLVRLYDAQSGALVRDFDRGPNGVASLAVNAERGAVVTASEKSPTKFYDLSAGPICALERDRELRSIAFSPDGRTVVLGDPSDSSLSFWDAGDCRRLGEFDQRGFVFSPDGRSIAEWKDGKAVNLYDASKLRLARTLRGHTDYVTAFAFGGDGKHGASASRDGTVRLWELATGQSLRTFEGQPGTAATAVVFSADGRVLATGAEDGTLKLWDANTGRALNTLAGHTRAVVAVSFSPDGKTVASGDIEGGVRLWDAKTGAAARTLGSFPLAALSVFYGPDGKTVAALGAEKNAYDSVPAELVTFKLWDAGTGRLILDLKGTDVKSAAFGRGGRAVLVAAGLPYKETTTKVYSATTGELLADVVGFVDGSWVVVTPEGFFDGPPAAWGQIAWRFAGNKIAPVEIFFNEFYRPGLLAEVLDAAPPKAPRAFAQLDRRQPRLTLSRADAAKPEDEVTTRTLKVKIDVTDAPAGARDVRLFRNGSLVKVWRGDVLQKGAATTTVTTLEAEIVVEAGENALVAYAFNRDDIKSADATLGLKGASALARKGVARLLAVGVNSYSNPRYDLKYAVADAAAFGEEFKRQQERLGRYERVEVTTLADARATKAGILSALADLAAKAEPEDAVVVFFAGHGTARENRFYLLPHDLGYAGAPAALDRAGLERMLAAGVSDRELERAFEKIDAARVLFVIDACNSGQALEAAERRRGPMNSKGLAQLAYEKGMYVLTASQSYEAAQEASQLGHGLLTYALVEEGLKRAAADAEPKDGRVFVKEWLDYAARRVPEIQLDEMARAAAAGRELAFGEDDRGLTVARRQGQRPRLYYRRELEAHPLVVAGSGN